MKPGKRDLTALEKALSADAEDDEQYLINAWNTVADRVEAKLTAQNKFLVVSQLASDYTVKAGFTGFATLAQAETAARAAFWNNSNPNEQYYSVVVPVFPTPASYHSQRGAENKEAGLLATRNPRELLLAEQRAWYTEHPNEPLPEELDKGPWDD